MTISITNLNVSNTAPAGTVVGVLSAQDASGNLMNCTFSLTKASAGIFAISGNDLVTAWAGPVIAGYYSVRVHALGIASRFSGNATFIVQVDSVAAVPAPPPPS
ncbi:MAG: hypothetical protein JO320_05915 [Alphaproteobacteria bacterium]|nr:hypothetical protein [Alphaproteobacteria bacterium]